MGNRARPGPVRNDELNPIAEDDVKRFEERTDPRSGERYLAVFERGSRIKDDPLLNKGTCFTREERERLGLDGLLPPAVQTQEEQEARAYGNYVKAGDPVQRYLFLAGLQDRNEVLFYRLVLKHLEEMIPVIYTPTVGKACEHYSHIYRRARGLYVSTEHRGHIESVLRDSPYDEPRIIVVTDNEAILGLGDQGVGGMPIAIGKLALYSVGAGIHPAACLPLDLDVGTNNPALLADPLYLGVRQRRLRGAEYLSLLDELVEAIAKVFPRALVQWEDFANRTAFEVLERYRRRILSFDDDIQGTGAVIVAGIRSAARQVGRTLEDERVLFYGTGASGGGCALAVRHAMREAGVPEKELSHRVLCLDSKGVIVADRHGLEYPKQSLAAEPAMVAGWPRAQDGSIGLAEAVRAFHPTVLVGTSGQPGAFTEEIVHDMFTFCRRPIFLPISNPTNKAEACPEDLMRWTKGSAVIGTGSPFPDVHYEGRTFVIGQGNNALVFPGIGLGATAVQARQLPDGAFAAASRALFEFTQREVGSAPGAPIYPPVSRLRDVSREVAIAVGQALVDLEAAPHIERAEIERRVTAAMWEPEYLPYRLEVPAAKEREPATR